jgi:PAS domain S-box-containing protein
MEVYQREAWFRNIFSNAPVGIVLLDSHFKAFKFNKHFQKLTGYEEHELINKNLENIIHPDDLLLGQAFEDYISNASSFTREQRLCRKDGSTFWTRSISAPMTVENHKYTIAMYTDISLEKQAEIKLLESSRLLKTQNDALEEFSYVISHDLQEPLRMITSFSQIIQKKHLPRINDENANKDFNFVIEGAKRMSSLIKDMLEYSRWSARQLPTERVDVKEVLEETLQNLTVAIDSSKAVIDIGDMLVFYTNKLMLRQVFQNLIGNAIRYTAPAKLPHITLKAEKNAGEMVFSVKDNGVGIEDKNKEKIFGIFQRLSNNKTDGNGMGLAICKRIIERQGGRIWVESTVGEGSTFYFALPVSVIPTEGVSIQKNELELVDKI